MPSIKQAQESLGKGFFAGGDEKQGALKLDGVERVIFEAADKFIMLAKRRIAQKKKIDKGNLSDIEVSAIKRDGDKYSLTIGYDKANPARAYYDFQNKGVQGIRSGQPNSEYKFRTLSVSKNMVEAILQWYLRHKNYIRNDDQRKGLSALQVKRKTISSISNPRSKLLQIATNTAKSIKKKGIARVGFFDDNLDLAFGQDFKAKLSRALGYDVSLAITQTFNTK